MRVSTEKATWFALALCTLLVFPGACRRDLGATETGTCPGAGIVSSKRVTLADGSELAAEIVQNGCADCSHSVRPGAAPGAPCSAASVCQEFCCNCSNLNQNLRYRSRVCCAGSCLAAPAACAAARASIEPDVCSAP
jgi:hypothetical protein